MERKDSSRRGFTLMETLLAMFVAVVGLPALAVLISYGVGLQVLSRDSTMASSLAKDRIEQIRVTDSSDAQLSIGGDLDSNVADHFDQLQGFTRRWLVAAGPVNTLDVTVRVIATDPNEPVDPAEFQILLEVD